MRGLDKCILCLGDSLTFGARDEFHRGYPSELSRLYWEKRQLSVACVNHGVSGQTSGEILRRTFSVSQNTSVADTALLIAGTNDTFVNQPLTNYYDNLRQMCSILKSRHDTLGLGLLPPASGIGLPNYPMDAQTQIDSFNEVVRECAVEFECVLADFTVLGDFIIDTVHFSNAGYKKMAEIWYDVLESDNTLGVQKNWA